MSLHILFPHLRGFRLLSYHREAKRLILTCERVTRTALCPVCGTAAHRIQSRYQRTVWDLSMQNVQVILHLHVRKFSCDQPSCQPGPGRTCHQVIVCWGWLMPAERIL